jgi:hypothetical protein
MSRHALEHPDEKPVATLPYERVLKYNPNHGSDGRFAPSGGGRPGGTMGAPTTGAFGQKLKGMVKGFLSRFDYGVTETNPTLIELERKAKARTKEVETNTTLIELERKAKARTVDSYENLPFRRGMDESRVEKLPYKAGSPPAKATNLPFENPAGPGFQFSNEQRRRHAREMFGSKDPTRRSSFS